MEEYKKKTGRDVSKDFPYWEPTHRILYTHGIFGCENVRSDIDKVMGKRCLIIGFPLKWIGGDGSMHASISGCSTVLRRITETA